MEPSIAQLQQELAILEGFLASLSESDKFVAPVSLDVPTDQRMCIDVSSELKPFFRRLFSSDILEAPNCNLGEFGDNIDVTFEVVGSGDEIAHVVVFAEVEEQREHEKREHVSPTRKSSCSVCKKPRDDMHNFAERFYCKECFKCKTCLVELNQLDFSLFGQQLFCSAHSLKCHVCEKPFVDGKVVTALSKRFHLDCFACNKCKRPFGKNEAVFVGDDGLPFCEEHAPESSEEGETGDPTYSTSEVD